MLPRGNPQSEGHNQCHEVSLDAGRHPHPKLQKASKERGVAGIFVFEVLEKLEYDKGMSKTDYSEELEITPDGLGGQGCASGDGVFLVILHSLRKTNNYQRFCRTTFSRQRHLNKEI